jgi:cytochrome P450
MDSHSKVIVWTTTISATAIAALLAARARAQKRVESPIFQGLPFAPGAHWALGHLIMLNANDNFIEGYHQVYEKYADPETGLCAFWFAYAPAVSVLLSHHVKTVLNGTSFRQIIPLLQTHNFQFLGPQALTSLNGKEWKLYRTAVHKSFTPAALKLSQACMNQVGTILVQSLLNSIDQSETTSLQQPILPYMKMATMDVLGLAARHRFSLLSTIETHRGCFRL